MIIPLNDHYQLHIDTKGNHTPYKFCKGGELITSGKYKDQLTKDRWYTTEKYFINIGQALDWIAKDSMLNEFPVMDLVDFVATYEKRTKELESLTLKSLKEQL